MICVAWRTAMMWSLLATTSRAFTTISGPTTRQSLIQGYKAGYKAGHCARRTCMSDSNPAAETVTKLKAKEEVDPGKVKGTKLKILKYPHPALRAENVDVKEFDDSIKKFVRGMFKVMYASEGVGLAAPQVGVNLRLMVFNPEGDEQRWLDEAVLINPRIVETSKSTVTAEEGCLSFPGMRGKVERPSWVKIEAVNASGKKVKKKFTNWTARIFQHEYDHLDGTVYVDRLSPEERERVQPRLNELIADYGEGGSL